MYVDKSGGPSFIALGNGTTTLNSRRYFFGVLAKIISFVKTIMINKGINSSPFLFSFSPFLVLGSATLQNMCLQITCLTWCVDWLGGEDSQIRGTLSR